MRELPERFEMIDTHCHVDLFPDPKKIVDETVSDHICTIAVTNAPFLFENTQELATRSQLILPALGLHPELVKSHGNQLDQFHRLLPKTRFVGEVGLDYVTNDNSERAEQRRIFESIVDACSIAGNKVLTVHSRRSSSDVLSILKGKQVGAVIFHWYSGSLRDLRLALSAGYYFSLNAAMVRSDRGQRLIRELPLDRILTESDGPFAKCSGKPSTPRSVSIVIEYLATSLKMPPDTVRQKLVANAKQAIEFPAS